MPWSRDTLSKSPPSQRRDSLVAIATRRPTSAEEVFAVPDAIVLVAIDVQDPGNVGALMRTAEAGGMTGIFVGGASANPFSWKSIRGSMGSALRLPVVGGMPIASILRSLRNGDIRTIAAVPRGGQDPDAIDCSSPAAQALRGQLIAQMLRALGHASAAAAVTDGPLTGERHESIERARIAVLSENPNSIGPAPAWCIGVSVPQRSTSCGQNGLS